MYAIPSLKDLVERARARFRANLPGSDAWIWPNNVNPTAKVIGGMTHEVMGFADYIARQKFALTADEENLAFHGEEIGVPRKPAAPARGPVDIVTSAALAADVGAVLRRSDGVEFIATAGGSITGAGTLSLDVIAATDGADTITLAGTALELVSGFSGDDTATASAGSAGIGGGLDIEDVESWRARILFRKRNPPHGGSAADYVSWAGEVSGVSFNLDRPTVFVERLWAGVGTVRVFPLMFDLYANGIPQPADLQRVSDHIEMLRPSGAKVSVQAPIAVPVNITIDGLVPLRSDVEQAITEELTSAFRRLSRAAGTDQQIGGMPYLAYPTSFSRSWIWQAVANASGEERHIITAPAADIALSAGQMATLGTITFT